VVAIFSSTFWWLEFFQPLIYLNTADHVPLSLSLALINNRNYNDVQSTFAMTTIALIPLIALFSSRKSSTSRAW
jgi:ABC-type glycerol-3-phosphate transport system permease component